MNSSSKGAPKEDLIGEGAVIEDSKGDPNRYKSELALDARIAGAAIDVERLALNGEDTGIEESLAASVLSSVKNRYGSVSDLISDWDGLSGRGGVWVWIKE